MRSVSEMLHYAQPVGDPEARYFHSGVNPEFMPPAGVRGVPPVHEGIVDDGAHGTRGGIRGVRNAAPWARIRRFQVRAQPASVLSATPHADPDAPVIVRFNVAVATGFRRPPELPGAHAPGTH